MSLPGTANTNVINYVFEGKISVSFAEVEDICNKQSKLQMRSGNIPARNIKILLKKYNFYSIVSVAVFRTFILNLIPNIQIIL